MMGKIKDKITDNSKEFDLTDFEASYCENINQLSIQAAEGYRMVISQFLSYTAGTRLGYKKDTKLQFELDLKAKKLKITELPD